MRNRNLDPPTMSKAQSNVSVTDAQAKPPDKCVCIHINFNNIKGGV